MPPNLLRPDEAAQMILNKKARGPIEVDGILDLSNNPALTRLPKGLRCYELDASETGLESLPDDIQVECAITLRNCRRLSKLPSKLTTGTLDLRGSTALTALPEGLNVWFLDAGGCSRLSSFPRKARISNGGVSIAGCEKMNAIPAYVKQLSSLDISDCPLITKLPKSLRVRLWIDVAGCGLTSMPAGFEDVALRWRGVPVDERIAFRPEEITSADVAAELNAERRRVLIERMGFEKYFAEAKARCLDSDTDPGGERRLLKVKIPDDEDMVCLSCRCPSTGRHYLLRVPPKTKTCHQAAAWMAGFDDPSKYQPVRET